MPGRPPKPLALIKSEGNKCHLTKAEMKLREDGEKSLLTETKMSEWPETKANKTAHQKFNRIKKLLKKISHDDALYEPVINRYCLLLAECEEVERTVQDLRKDIVELATSWEEAGLDYLGYIDKKGKMQDRIIVWDRKLMDKRKMLLSIEKENVMTILGALRAIPKKPADNKSTNPMEAFLNRKRAGENA